MPNPKNGHPVIANLNDIAKACMRAIQGMTDGQMPHQDAIAIARTVQAACKCIELNHKLGGDVSQYVVPREPRNVTPFLQHKPEQQQLRS